VKPVTETVKIDAPRDLVERLNRRGADVEKIVLDALTHEDERADREELRRLAREASAILKKVPDEAIVKAIRK
jgi:precorrin-6B methylase 1